MKKHLHWPVWAILAALLLAAMLPVLGVLHSKTTAAHAASAASTPTLTLAASVVYPDEKVQATATGFAPGDLLYIGIGNTYFDSTISCDQNGNCAGVMTMPTLVQGSYSVIATATSGLAAQTSVTFVPHITVSPSNGGPGSTIQLQGAGFAANESVQVYWNGSQGVLEGTAYSYYDGSLSFSFTAPTGIAPGLYHIAIVRSHQTPTEVNAKFMVRLPALASTAGIRDGQAIHVKLFGFQASEQVTLSWNANGGQTISTLTMDSTGAANTYVVPPAATRGSYTLTAKGRASKLRATAGLNIGPGIQLALNTSNPGGTITVNGGGFITGETVNVYFQTTSNGIVAATVDASGSFSVSLNVPFQHYKNVIYYVYAVSTMGSDKAKAEFYYMTPALQVDSDIYYKSQFTVTGQGFANSETVTLYWAFSGQKYPQKLGTTQAVSDGTFSLTAVALSAPYMPFNPYSSNVSLVARGSVTKTPTAIFAYEPAMIIPNKSDGAIGSMVHVVGGAFGSAEPITVFLDNVQVAALTDAVNGAFAVDFKIPKGLPLGGNAFSLNVRGSSSGINLFSTFFVYLPLSISPHTGTSGTSIAVNGWDYNSSAQVNLYWCNPTGSCNTAGTPLASVSTTRDGKFKTTISAPANLVSGHTYEVIATYQGNNSELAYAQFIAQ